MTIEMGLLIISSIGMGYYLGRIQERIKWRTFFNQKNIQKDRDNTIRNLLRKRKYYKYGKE